MALYLNRSIVDAVVDPVLGKFQLVSNLSGQLDDPAPVEDETGALLS